MVYDGHPDTESGHDNYEAEYFGSDSDYGCQDVIADSQALHDVEALKGMDAWDQIGVTLPEPQRKGQWAPLLIIGGALLAVAFGLVAVFVVREVKSPTPTSGLPTDYATSDAGLLPTSAPSSTSTSHPEALVASLPVSTELHIAIYDSQGELVSVTDSRAWPADEIAASGFPACLGRGQTSSHVDNLTSSLGGLSSLDGVIFDEAIGQLLRKIERKA